MLLFFFFKQKTAYEMRISDWSSDVCSSDLRLRYPCPAHRRSPMRLDRRLANGSAPMQFSATGHGCPAATMHNRRGGINARKWTRTGAGVPAGRGDRGAGVQEARPRGGAGVHGGGREIGRGAGGGRGGRDGEMAGG